MVAVFKEKTRKGAASSHVATRERAGLSGVSGAAAVPTQDELRLLRDVRRAGLLRKWTSGQTLAPEEMAEVADLVPPQYLVTPPLPSPGYKHSYDHYAKIYGYDLRNINRLIGLGRIARCLAPLDDPAAMPAWWEEMKAAGHFKQKCPQRIHDAATRATEQVGAPPVGTLAPNPALPAAIAASGAAVPGAPGQPPAKVNVDDLKAFGIAEAVKELSLQLAADQQELRLARINGLPEATVNRRLKAFNDTLDSLRKTEKALQDLQVARGDLAPIAQFREDLATILTTVRGMMRRRADNVCAKLADQLSAEQLAAVRAALAVEAAREEAMFRSARHWQRAPDGTVVLPPDPSAP